MKNIRLAIIVSRFNSEFTEKLLHGALGTLKSKGISENQYKVVKVPGAFELPLVAKTMAATKEYDAVITLGAVIRGDTYHFEVVCDQAAAGVQRASLDTGVPVIFGVITTDTEEQAAERCGGAHGNKGSDAVMAALEMIEILKK